MQVKKKSRIIKLILVSLVIYVVGTGFLPFVFRPSIEAAYIEAIEQSQFYGIEEGIDRVALVETPQEGFETRMALIRSATKTLDISYYAIHSGTSTDLIFAEILAAADRGVQVRLLFDGMSGKLKKDKEIGYLLASHPNIAFKLYNKTSIFKPWTWNGRLHDKYIIVDDQVMLLGGRNLGDKYFDPEGYTGQLSLDRDVLVFNTAYEDKSNNQSVLFEVKAYMEAVFNSKYVVNYESKTNRKTAAKQKALEVLRGEVEGVSEIDYYAVTVPANKVSLLHNDYQILAKSPKVLYGVGYLMEQAVGEVWMQSPYVIEDKQLKQVLTQLKEAEIEVTLLTNSMASTPNFPAYAAYLGGRRQLLKNDLILYEYQGANAIHAKSYIVDQRLSMVGSMNLDPRSFYIDTELMLVIDSEAFTDSLRDTMNGYLATSVEVATNGQYLPSDVAVAEGSLLKKGMLTVLSPFMRIFKFLV